jgi:diguanylate cyclase (GGDEF)-like protein/PAS domain S-box-containing protein
VFAAGRSSIAPPSYALEKSMDKLFLRILVSVKVSALITLCTGLGLTMLLFATIRRVELTSYQTQFKQDALVRASAISTGLGDAVEQLQVLNQLFSTLGTVSRQQFHEFTRPLLQRYPELSALSYQRVLRHDERAAYEARMQARLPGFTVTEFIDGQHRKAGVRDTYNVVEFIEPAGGNEAAVGLDTAADNEHTGARQRSRANGTVAVTGLLSLVQHRGYHAGFLALAPVYLRGAPLDSPGQRHRAAIGETAAVFRVDRLVDTLLGATHLTDDGAIGVSLFAAATLDEQALAFRHGSATLPERALPLLPRWLVEDSAAPYVSTFKLAGTPWTVQVARAPTLFATLHHGSLIALLGGFLLSVLAAAQVYTLVSRRSTIERATDERTAALRFANLRLSEDLALRQRSEKTLRLREKVIDVSANAIVICSAVGPDHAIDYVNPAFEEITGFAAADVLGKPLTALQGASDDQQNLDAIRAALREQREGHALLRNYRKDGSGYWNELYIAPVRDDAGVISHFVVAQYDISAVKHYEAELEFQARHDALTGLANRNLLHERLGAAIAAAGADGGAVWVAFVDLDRFKFVNDTLGHEAGDSVLKALATRLKRAARPCDTVARMGGDEFVLVIPQPGGSAGPGMDVLAAVMAAVAEPLTIQSHEFFLTCSVGVAVYPVDGDCAETLAKHADIAMYRAKEQGRNAMQFYTPSMNERTLERLRLEADLRHALARGELLLHYQPQVEVASGRVIGMEALVRWQHPQLGMIAPGRFIGLAEEMGLIVPIGAWVLRTACEQTRRWHLAGHPGLRVAVNLSARQFTQRGLAEMVASVLHETGLAPSDLELELTESMVMHDVENAITILRTLKELGVQIAIDDFGTGYSSLSYLRRFPINVLKIDQSFVSELTLSSDDAAIVASIISLAHSLRLTVTAEGVETERQHTFLRAHGCDQMQGYLVARPLDADAFGAFLASQ